MRIAVRAFFDRSLAWEQAATWERLASSLAELRRGRTIFIDSTNKFLVFYTATYHYFDPAPGAFVPASLTELGPL